MEEAELQELQELLSQYGSTTTTTTTYGAGDPTMGWLAGYTAAMSMWWTWVIAIIQVVSMWMIFVKAGRPGWAAIIPFYNIWVLLEVIHKPWWWLLLMLIPFVNIVMAILVARETARVFGQGIAFTIGLIFLPFIFYPILAFSSEYKYQG